MAAGTMPPVTWRSAASWSKPAARSKSSPRTVRTSDARWRSTPTPRRSTARATAPDSTSTGRFCADPPPIRYRISPGRRATAPTRSRSRASSWVSDMAIPHPRDIQVAVVDWLDERYPFTKAVDEALYQRVPNYANAFYYCFGGMVFILIVFQLLTGILLSFYYVPDAASPTGGGAAPAYNSVNFIQNEVYLGWLIRGVHFWSANLLIIMVLIHMARVYWTGSYRAPRELNWIVGVLMLLIILVLSLTGYLLPWDTKAYFATEVTIKIAGSAPPQWLGMFIKEILQAR